MFFDELKWRFRGPLAAARSPFHVERLDDAGIAPESMAHAEQRTRPGLADLVIPEGAPEEAQRDERDSDAADHPRGVGQNLTHRGHRVARLNRRRDLGV